MAMDAWATRSAKRIHSGSRWKFQCDRLFGSFHNTIPSTICVAFPEISCPPFPSCF